MNSGKDYPNVASDIMACIARHKITRNILASIANVHPLVVYRAVAIGRIKPYAYERLRPYLLDRRPFCVLGNPRKRGEPTRRRSYLCNKFTLP